MPPSILLALLSLAQSPTTTFGGSGNDPSHGIAADPSGNIYVVGTTSSTDLPLLNPQQTANTGTQLLVSPDAGATWKPFASPFPAATPFQPTTIAADPVNPATVYIASGKTLCKSTGAGPIPCTALPFPFLQSTISGIVIDPANPKNIYASATVNGGVAKSTDGGATWTNTSTGLPSNVFVDGISMDPFHPSVLYIWVGGGGYVSDDGAATWKFSTLPWSNLASFTGGVTFSFDLVTPGVIYGPGLTNGNGSLTIQKSIDAGKTWTRLTTPFNTCCVTPDPKTSGVLYTLARNGDSQVTAFWKSTDGGANWKSSPVPAGVAGPLAIDPANPLIMLASGFRTTDGGVTWTKSGSAQSTRYAFAPSSPATVYATGPITTDAYVAKFLPDGKTLAFATYFGGLGNDSGNSIALDDAGNIWITGFTTSPDLPTTPGAYQSAIKGATNAFVAKFSNDGKLLASTYFGGTLDDRGLGIAVAPNRNPWITGHWASPAPPFANPNPNIAPYPNYAFVAEFDATASQLLFGTMIDGVFDANGKGIAIDPAGNVTVAGSTYDSRFAATTSPLPNRNNATTTPKAIVMKFDPSGRTLYSTVFSGSESVKMQFSGGESDNATAVAVDSAGNAYITGYTSGIDFPTTTGVPFSAGCTFPAFSQATGLIGTIFTYAFDDAFVVKLTPDGKTAVYSTLIGGSCFDRPYSIAVDANGSVAIAGETDSPDFPLVNAVEPAPALRQFASFLSMLNPSGTALTFSSYLRAGSTPSLASSSGAILLAGSHGPGAQSFPDSGNVNPFPLISTDTYLATIRPPAAAPPFNLTQVRNAFSLQSGPIAPGEIVTLTIPGLVPDQYADIGINLLSPLTTNLAGAQVTFDGNPAYLISVYPGKIMCIAPSSITAQTSIQVTFGGASSNALTVPVTATAIGFLSLDGSGTGLANARNADGTLNGPDNPAALGSQVILFLTGAGVANPDLGAYPLQGFVPGLFFQTLTVPNNSQQAPRLTVSPSPQSLFIYIH